MRDISSNFAGNRKRDLHTIIVKKGSRIIPLYPINQLSDIGDPEMELLFDARGLKKHIGYYELGR